MRVLTALSGSILLLSLAAHSMEGGSPTQGEPYEEEEPSSEIIDQANELKAQGHTCVLIVGVRNHRLEWCGESTCQDVLNWDNMKKRDKQIKEEAKRLRRQGHSCVSFGEGFPHQLIWCGSNPCKKSY